ncbi:MAG: hypothetical protein IPL40_02495 [Proteobacteria bacterium]|nr:hypothetical protein [Pseudomonadota bacterium]
MKRKVQPILVLTTGFLRRALPLAAVLVVVGAGSGCRHTQFIAETKVVDTPINREIIEVVEQYRRAMEQRDQARVLTLVDPTYSDRSGTPEAGDDLDFEGLKRALRERLGRCDRVRYRLEYRGVEVRGRAATVDVWIDATFVYQQPNSPPLFRRFADYQRYELLHTDRRWRFVSGL